MKSLLAYAVLLIVVSLVGAFQAHKREAAACKIAGGHMGFAGHFVMVWQVTDYKTGQGFMNMQPYDECIVP